MRLLLISIFLIQALALNASQIALGLRTKNIGYWNVFVNKKGVSKLKMLIYNKTSIPIHLKIQFKSFTYTSPNFKVKDEGELYKEIKLNPGQLYFIDMPEGRHREDLMDFYENGKSIGLMEIEKGRPSRQILETSYPYFYNYGQNWIGVSSLTNPEIELRLFLHETDVYAYYIRLFTSLKEGESYWLNLDKLFPKDASIRKYTNLKEPCIFQIKRKQNEPVFIPYYIIFETLKTGTGPFVTEKGNTGFIEIGFFKPATDAN